MATRQSEGDIGEAAGNIDLGTVFFANLANRVDLGAVQNLFRGCGVALVYRSGPREAVVCLNDEAGVGRALRLDGSVVRATAISVTRMNAEAGEP